MADRESTSPPLDVLFSVLESMEENLRQEAHSLIANSFGYDNPGYGGSGYGRYGDDTNGTRWLSADGGGEATVGFRDEAELSSARFVGRDLAKNNEFAINGHENRVSYIIGTGHTYVVTKKKDVECPEAWLKLAQERVDEFLKRNNWAARQEETVKRIDRDGEAFLRKFEKDGQLVVRVVEPSQVFTPKDMISREDVTFGILTEPDDVEEVLAYFVDEEPIDADQIQHRKGLVDSNVKRGCPLFFSVRDRLLHAQKLLVNMARTSDTQTAIAMIRRHQGMTAGSADAYKKEFLDKLDATGNIPTQSRGNENVALYEPGSIIDSSQRTEYEFPNQGLDASRYVTVLQAILRAAAGIVQMPEFMFTGDASNANLASTLVSEGPAVKRFQREQSKVEKPDLELLREDLKMGADLGEYPLELLDCIEITVGKPDVNVRDRKEEAEVNQIYLNMRVKSPQTIAGEQGLDFEQEQENFDDLEPEELPPLQTNDPEDPDDDGPRVEEPPTRPTEQKVFLGAPVVEGGLDLGPKKPIMAGDLPKLPVPDSLLEQEFAVRWDTLESELD